MFKRLFCCAYFQGSLFSEGLIIGRSFAFQNGFIGLDNKNSLRKLALTIHGLVSEGLIIGRIFSSEIWGFIFVEIYLFVGWGKGGGEGGVIIRILQ